MAKGLDHSKKLLIICRILLYSLIEFFTNAMISIVFTKQSPILCEAEGNPGGYHGTEIMDENLSQAKGSMIIVEDFPILVILKQAGTGAYRSATGGSPPSTGAGIPQKEEIGRKSSWLGSTLGSLLLGYGPPFDPRLDRQDRFPLLNMY